MTKDSGSSPPQNDAAASTPHIEFDGVYLPPDAESDIRHELATLARRAGVPGQPIRIVPSMTTDGRAKPAQITWDMRGSGCLIILDLSVFDLPPTAREYLVMHELGHVGREAQLRRLYRFYNPLVLTSLVVAAFLACFVVSILQSNHVIDRTAQDVTIAAIVAVTAAVGCTLLAAHRYEEQYADRFSVRRVGASGVAAAMHFSAIADGHPRVVSLSLHGNIIVRSLVAVPFFLSGYPSPRARVRDTARHGLDRGDTIASS